MGWRTRLRASISASTFLRNSSTGTALKPAGSGAKTILDQADLARHPAAGRLRMRIAAYVQFQEQRLVLRVSRSIAAQAFGRDRENRLERERDLVQGGTGFKASARRTDAFRAGSDIVRWGRIFISEEELQHCCNGFEVI